MIVLVVLGPVASVLGSRLLRMKEVPVTDFEISQERKPEEATLQPKAQTPTPETLDDH